VHPPAGQPPWRDMIVPGDQVWGEGRFLALLNPALARWFDTEAFVRQPNYTFGNAPRNAIETPGVVNFDLAVYKVFRPAERAELQFRAEAFNALNTPHFGNPGAQLGTSSFGVISSSDDSRTLQFGLKLRW
jgi:hypothetical protein